MLRRIDPRILIGSLLILGGLLALLDNLGIIRDASGVFWGIVFGGVGLVFLYVFITNAGNWWRLSPLLHFLASRPPACFRLHWNHGAVWPSWAASAFPFG
jgi:hypothetical protein